MPRALIIDGQNNHDWASTTPVLADQLTRAGFSVDVCTSPPKGASASAWDDFQPDFQRELIVSNYTDIVDGVAWPDTAIDAMCDAAEAGAGFVAVHAAASAFWQHDRFWQLIGAGWREQGGHGANESFSVTLTDAGRTLMPNLPAVLPHVADERWFGMTGPATRGEASWTVLATAHSPETQRDEPMMWSLSYGRGRSFVTVLGHDTAAMRCPTFEQTFTHGCRWAARIIP